MRVIYVMGLLYLSAVVLLWAGRWGKLSRKAAAFASVFCLAAGSGALATAVIPRGNVYGPTVTVLPELPSLSGAAVPGREIISPVGKQVGNSLVASTDPTRCMALTFDDGPYPPYTGRLLDVLKEKKIHATFFLVASQAQRYPSLVKRMEAEGHTIGLHAFQHRDFLKLTEEEKRRDLAQGKETLREITGKTPLYWRPPHGFRDSSVMETAKAQQLVVVNWSVIPRDWSGINKQEIYNRVVDKAENGSIVLLHDGDSPFYQASRQATVDAVSPIIDSLREKGYHLVSLDEFAGRKISLHSRGL